jgi:hypothetical protein
MFRSSARRRFALVAVALLALVCLTGALLDESFVHTDDGCAFETHCVACLLSAASVVVASQPLTAPFVLARTIPIPSPRTFSVRDADLSIEVSRGPPAPRS